MNAKLEATTREDHDRQMVRWARVHADACRVGDRELRRMAFRAMTWHTGDFEDREADMNRLTKPSGSGWGMHAASRTKLEARKSASRVRGQGYWARVLPTGSYTFPWAVWTKEKQK